MSAANAGDSARLSRRNILYATTAVVGAAGLAAAAWPFIDHLNPDAGTRASGDVIEVDLAGLAPADHRVLHWHGLPIFVGQRTAAIIESLRDQNLLARMIDPRSNKRQQPAYAANWHRSIDPAISVLVGVCTYCACVPQFAEAPLLDDVAGGTYCPCCASHFDPAGRPYAGPAQYNLPVPPHDIVKASRLVIGRNTSDVSFTLDSIERM